MASPRTPKLAQHPPKDELFKLRMTREERAMLRALAVRSAAGSDSACLRALIRDAWALEEALRAPEVVASRLVGAK